MTEKEIHVIENMSCQGDVAITRVDSLPKGLKKVQPTQDNVYIVAHSETLHHHVVTANGVEFYEDPSDSLVAFIKVAASTPLAVLRHLRSFNTHKPQAFKGGNIYKISKQRQATIDGWERVAD